jgi:hypothetical protein
MPLLIRHRTCRFAGLPLVVQCRQHGSHVGVAGVLWALLVGACCLLPGSAAVTPTARVCVCGGVWCGHVHAGSAGFSMLCAAAAEMIAQCCMLLPSVQQHARAPAEQQCVGYGMQLVHVLFAT